MPLTHEELLKLYHKGESDRLELKANFDRTIHDHIAKTICAFANDLAGYGLPGVVILGLEDASRQCSGLIVTEQLILQVSAFIRDGKIAPFPICRIYSEFIDECPVVIIEVEPSAWTPVFYEGKIFVRSGAMKREAKRAEEIALTAKQRFHSFDSAPIRASSLEDLNLFYLQEVILPLMVDRKVLIENDRPLYQQLTALKLVAQEVPTLAGLLVGGYDPRSVFPGSYIQFVRIDGLELTDNPVTDEEEISGRVDEMIQRAMDKVTAHNMNALIRTDALTAESQPEYPVAALREAIVNAVLHRDYETTNTPVRIYWYNDRVEIISPGGPFGTVTEDNFATKGAQDYRNPILATFLKSLKFIQRFGSGIMIIRRELELNQNPEPVFDAKSIAHGNYVQVTFRRRV